MGTVQYSKKYDLPDVFRYDSVNPFTLTFKDGNNNAINMSSAVIKMTFLLNGTEYIKLSNGDGISISQNVATFSIKPFNIAGTFTYDIQVEKDGVKRTYLYGQILVHNEITKG